MSALAANNLAVLGGQGDSLPVEAKAATVVYDKSLAMRDVNGFIVPHSSAAGVLLGLVDGQASATSTPRYLANERDCLLLAVLTGVTIANIGQPVFAVSDNPADLTLTYVAGARVAGFVACLEYQAGGLGAVANKAWVFLTDKIAGAGQALLQICHTSNLRTISAKTVRSTIYKCPANRRAIVLGVDISIMGALPNYATSAALDCSKVVAAVRTSLLSGTVDINSGTTAKVADTPFALTGAATPFVTLSNGDRVEFSVVTVGASTVDSDIEATALILEYGYAL